MAADAVHEDTQPPDSAAPLDRPPSPVTDLFSPPVNTEGEQVVVFVVFSEMGSVNSR